MSTHSDTLQVEIRKQRGKREAQRMRLTGKIPAVLYGLGQENVSLTVPADQVAAVMRHGTRVVKLKGAVAEDVLIREVQWDPFGQDVLHIDFGRFAAGDRTQASIPLELRGEAPGTHEGGVVHQALHELEIECRVVDLPEVFHVNINQLHLNDVIHAEDLELPPGTRLVHGNEVVVTCEAMKEEVEEEEEGAATEPELIGRDEDQEQDQEESD